MEVSEPIFKNLKHRYFLISNINKYLEKKQKNIDNNIESHNVKFKTDLEKIRKEIKEVHEEVDLVVKRVYKVGGLLKDKINKNNFNKMKDIIDNWKLEEFIQKKELEKSFNKYSNYS